MNPTVSQPQSYITKFERDRERFERRLRLVVRLRQLTTLATEEASDTAELRRRCEWLRFIESADSLLRKLVNHERAA